MITRKVTELGLRGNLTILEVELLVFIYQSPKNAKQILSFMTENGVTCNPLLYIHRLKKKGLVEKLPKRVFKISDRASKIMENLRDRIQKYEEVGVKQRNGAR